MNVYKLKLVILMFGTWITLVCKNLECVDSVIFLFCWCLFKQTLIDDLSSIDLKVFS
jgi:hypothetical protein